MGKHLGPKKERERVADPVVKRHLDTTQENGMRKDVITSSFTMDDNRNQLNVFLECKGKHFLTDARDFAHTTAAAEFNVFFLLLLLLVKCHVCKIGWAIAHAPIAVQQFKNHTLERALFRMICDGSHPHEHISHHWNPHEQWRNYKVHVVCKGQLPTVKSHAPDKCNQCVSRNHDVHTLGGMIEQGQVLDIRKRVLYGAQPLPDEEPSKQWPTAFAAKLFAIQIPRKVDDQQKQENVGVNTVEGNVNLPQDKEEHVHFLYAGKSLGQLVVRPSLPADTCFEETRAARVGRDCIPPSFLYETTQEEEEKEQKIMDQEAFARLWAHYGFTAATPEAGALFEAQLKEKLEDLLLSLMLRGDLVNETTIDVEQLDHVKKQHQMYLWP